MKATDDLQKPKRARKGKKMEETAESKDPDVEPIDVSQFEDGTLHVSEYLKKEKPNLEENIQSFANLDIDDMMASKH